MCHRAKFRQNRPNSFGDTAIFRFSRWPPSAILDFEIIKHLVAHQLARVNMHTRAKFHQNRSNVVEISHLMFFSKWGPSAILDFLKI